MDMSEMEDSTSIEKFQTHINNNTTMSSTLYSTIIRELKEVASVEVVLSENPVENPSVITIDAMKMNEIMAGYDHLYTIVQRA
ncbi:hypothetical protein N7486_011333 [Penicillium sp. IBT 16267x]|nr:hypothetical protein N7486_011333 [Penicillium sp. IBT 16267x]